MADKNTSNSGLITVIVLVIIAAIALYYFWERPLKETTGTPGPAKVETPAEAPNTPAESGG